MTQSLLDSQPLDKMKVRVNINGKEYSHEVEPKLLLVHYLREVAELTGTHIGCDTTHCGACTVLIEDGGEWRDIKSCTMLAVQADGKKIVTVEGLARDGELHPIQKAFWDQHALQCGYCTPGMMMSALGFLASNRNPTEKEVKESIGNICRCTGYQSIVKAILATAKDLEGKPSVLEW